MIAAWCFGYLLAANGFSSVIDSLFIGLVTVFIALLNFFGSIPELFSVPADSFSAEQRSLFYLESMTAIFPRL